MDKTKKNGPAFSLYLGRVKISLTSDYWIFLTSDSKIVFFQVFDGIPYNTSENSKKNSGKGGFRQKLEKTRFSKHLVAKSSNPMLEKFLHALDTD